MGEMAHPRNASSATTSLTPRSILMGRQRDTHDLIHDRATIEPVRLIPQD
jgi:hypothetical protein